MPKSKEFKVSSGIIVVRKKNNKYEFLLLKSGNSWDAPKGRLCDNERFIDAAIRETAEETLLTPESLYFRWGYTHMCSDLYKKGKKFVIYFIAESKTNKITLPISKEIGRPEHEDYGWFVYDDATKIVSARVKEVLSWAERIIMGDAIL